MKRRVYRVQDAEGRGPFRPGLSKLWIDDTTEAPSLPTWMDEFGWDVCDRLGKPGEHFGSAVTTIDRISLWFTPIEQGRLARLGFQVVSFSDARVIAESENQVVFARLRPLREGASRHRFPLAEAA